MTLKLAKNLSKEQRKNKAKHWNLTKKMQKMLTYDDFSKKCHVIFKKF